MKKRTNQTVHRSESRRTISARVRATVRSIWRAASAAGRDGHDYEAARVHAELAVIAEHRGGFDRVGR